MSEINISAVISANDRMSYSEKTEWVKSELSLTKQKFSVIISDTQLEELKNGKVNLYDKVSTLEQTASEISASVKSNKEETDGEIETLKGQIQVLSDEVSISASKVYVDQAKQDAIDSSNSSTDEKLNNYSTTTEMNAAINIAVDGITSTVSKSITIGGRNLIHNSETLIYENYVFAS